MSETMLAAVYHGANDLRMEECPVPAISPDELLFKVVNTSICGTDLRILHGGHRKYPEGTIRIPGHEVVGNVASVGANVRGFSVGQRLFVAPNMGCGHCHQCITGNNNLCANYDAFGITIDGSFAEYMRVPAAAILQGNLIPLEPGVDAVTATLIEPFACVLRGQNAVNVHVGDVVVVVGAGPIGVMHALLARLRGATGVIVSEMIPERREQALRFGADVAVAPDQLPDAVKRASGGEGADVVIVAAPAHQAQEAAVQIAAIGGRINYFGGLPKDRPSINLDSNVVHYKELMVTGTTACSTADCRQAAAIVNSGRIDLSPIISARYGLSDFAQAFAAAEDRKSLKVSLQPGMGAK
jgi:L-iditol 2-dehydrogenase